MQKSYAKMQIAKMKMQMQRTEPKKELKCNNQIIKYIKPIFKKELNQSKNPNEI